VPTKFVQRSAERAGVSIETAEHKWAEAKHAIKKGKRRGHWYWGKVVNVFKKMMGLSEGMTFGEYLLLEAEIEWLFSHWPEVIRLYGPYIAVRDQHYDHYIKYEVEELMGEPVNVQLSASTIRGHNDAYEGGASYTAGKDGHFTQGLGIKVPADEAYDVNEFRKWAIEAMQTGTKKLGLTEEIDLDASDADFSFKMIKKALVADGFDQVEMGDMSAKFMKGNWAYDFYCGSEAQDTWQLYIDQPYDSQAKKTKVLGLTPTKLVAKIKADAAKRAKVTESDQGQYKNDTAERGMIHKIVDLLCQDGQMKGGQSEANLEKAYDFLESDWGGKLWDKHYELFVSMHPSFEGPMNRIQYGSFKREAAAWFKKWKNGAKFVGEPIERMHEGASVARK
jgi:hypothetical protein